MKLRKKIVGQNDYFIIKALIYLQLHFHETVTLACVPEHPYILISWACLLQQCRKGYVTRLEFCFKNRIQINPKSGGHIGFAPLMTLKRKK